MSETTTEQAQAAEATEVQEGATPDPNLGDAGKRALTAERDARKDAERQAAEYKAKLDDIEKANLSELERAQAEAKTAAADAEAARAEALRWRIAAKHGISGEDAEVFLTGADEDSLTRQAERLSALAVASTAPSVPKPDLTQGGTGGTGQQTLADRISEAEKAGDHKTALALKSRQLAELASK